MPYVEGHLIGLRLKVEQRRLEKREEGARSAHDAIQSAEVTSRKTTRLVKDVVSCRCSIKKY